MSKSEALGIGELVCLFICLYVCIYVCLFVCQSAKGNESEMQFDKMNVGIYVASFQI